MELYTNDFNYELPEKRIAQFPSEKREQSKLLVFSDNRIQHKTFKDIVSVLPDDSLLVFNNSRVIPARIHFQKDSGALIEIFLLGPENETMDYRDFFNMNSPVRCICTIGNKKKWRNQTVLQHASQQSVLKATLIDEANSIVEFSWDQEKKWGDVIKQLGEVPLPPYINRQPAESDKVRYQTVYSTEPGAVASPTAGLHFTNEILDSLKSRGIKFEFITLHVGAGTFLPIKTNKVEDHNMHSERLVFSRENIDCLLSHSGKIIPVGTTSCRSIESLYWFGNKLITENCDSFNISQYDPYKLNPNLISRKESLTAVADWMDKTNQHEIHGTTSIFIYPSYSFKMTDSLITNFHQPGSTLILLVAALIGSHWKEVYQEAINNDYRFLSYGDSSFLVPEVANKPSEK
jgi:S-adenosylmethionine:tRNA ribosyltransferase-isomerase